MPAEPRTKAVAISIDGGDWELNCQVTIPDGPAQLDDLLPLARSLSDAVVDATTRLVEQTGERVSCKKGCGACCRHLVAISQVEARRLRRLVEAMPEPRRSDVRARFAEARERFRVAGLLEQLERTEELTEDGYGTLCGAYFAQHIACPFLEDESCSIHAERPITCREYLVTSPAENCAHSITENVRRVKLPIKVCGAVARWQVQPSEHFQERWVPLILALAWAEAHPEDPPPKIASELLGELLKYVAEKDKSEDAL